jgi:hypothetical protein
MNGFSYPWEGCLPWRQPYSAHFVDRCDGQVVGICGHWRLPLERQQQGRIATVHQFTSNQFWGGKSERQLIENRYSPFVPIAADRHWHIVAAFD